MEACGRFYNIVKGKLSNDTTAKEANMTRSADVVNFYHRAVLPVSPVHYRNGLVCDFPSGNKLSFMKKVPTRIEN